MHLGGIPIEFVRTGLEISPIEVIICDLSLKQAEVTSPAHIDDQGLVSSFLKLLF